MLPTLVLFTVMILNVLVLQAHRYCNKIMRSCELHGTVCSFEVVSKMFADDTKVYKTIEKPETIFKFLNTVPKAFRRRSRWKSEGAISEILPGGTASSALFGSRGIGGG